MITLLCFSSISVRTNSTNSLYPSIPPFPKDSLCLLTWRGDCVRKRDYLDTRSALLWMCVPDTIHHLFGLTGKDNRSLETLENNFLKTHFSFIENFPLSFEREQHFRSLIFWNCNKSIMCTRNKTL